MKKILLVSNIHTAVSAQDVERICAELRGFGADVTAVSFSSGDALPVASADIIIAVGGDGTIMHVAKQAAHYDIPVLGINSGKLGFLAGLEMDETARLKLLFEDDYETEERMLLDVMVDGGDDTYLAMNEAVISRGALSRLVDLCVSAGDKNVMRYRADGVMVATPTGSTAYSLSAGGPVVHPLVPCMLLTPVCPHSLYSRSYVLPADTPIRIDTKGTQGDAYLSVDGETEIQLPQNGAVSVKRSAYVVRLIRLQTRSFYDEVENKLMGGQR